MTVSNHTPGPWKFTLKRAGGHQLLQGSMVVGKDGMKVCCFTRNDRMGTDEWLANARLIAAAPDLLALARTYEAWEADLIHNGDWSGDCVRLTQEQHDRMIELQAMRNAAVAKATGK